MPDVPRLARFVDTLARTCCCCLFCLQRMEAMEAVRGFKVRIIVSTDVMARGVDFDRVNLVVNVDLPPDAATYVHRVGRTGRFGSRGIAVALVSQQELRKLQRYLADVKGGEAALMPGCGKCVAGEVVWCIHQQGGSNC
jgi:hypothetical protein